MDADTPLSYGCTIREITALEIELTKLFGEESYRVVRNPCCGKYQGHNDYSIVFGSGKKLYIGIDRCNYVKGLREQLEQIKNFRAHQAENTAKLQAALQQHDTPFCSARVEIMPYPGTNDLIVYGVVVLTARNGMEVSYQTSNMHYALTGDGTGWARLENCIPHLLQDVCGDMAYCHKIEQPKMPAQRSKPPKRRNKELVR